MGCFWLRNAIVCSNCFMEVVYGKLAKQPMAGPKTFELLEMLYDSHIHRSL
jgi:hypothetical protein